MLAPLDFVKIFVSRAGQSTRLRLRDNRNNTNPIDFNAETDNHLQLPNPEIDTDVERDNVIIWELDPRSLTSPPEPGYFPIQSIENIVQTVEHDDPKYKGSESILTSDPEKAGNVFVAKVASPPAGKKFSNYKIVYTLPGDSTIYELDPKIQLNS